MMRRALVVLLVAGCGGSSKPLPAPPPPPAHPMHADPADTSDDDDSEPGFEVAGSKGRMDPTAIQTAVSPHSEELESCFTTQVAKRRFLAGKVEIKWNVDATGAITGVELATSDLGAWPVEKCLLDIARGMTFDKPKGGATDFSIPLEFVGKQASTWMDADAGQKAVERHLADLGKCSKAGAAPSDATITLYIGARGKVVSVGFATVTDDLWADCAEKRISAWTLPDPRGQIAKVAFHYPG